MGGTTRTVLITCITPLRLQSDETIQSLNYASRSKKIQQAVCEPNAISYNKIERHSKSQTPTSHNHTPVQNYDVYVEEVSKLRKEVSRLKDELRKEKNCREEVEDKLKEYEEQNETYCPSKSLMTEANVISDSMTMRSSRRGMNNLDAMRAIYKAQGSRDTGKLGNFNSKRSGGFEDDMSPQEISIAVKSPSDVLPSGLTTEQVKNKISSNVNFNDSMDSPKSDKHSNKIKNIIEKIHITDRYKNRGNKPRKEDIANGGNCGLSIPIQRSSKVQKNKRDLLSKKRMMSRSHLMPNRFKERSKSGIYTSKYSNQRPNSLIRLPNREDRSHSFSVSHEHGKAHRKSSQDLSQENYETASFMHTSLHQPTSLTANNSFVGGQNFHNSFDKENIFRSSHHGEELTPKSKLPKAREKVREIKRRLLEVSAKESPLSSDQVEGIFKEAEQLRQFLTDEETDILERLRRSVCPQMPALNNKPSAFCLKEVQNMQTGFNSQVSQSHQTPRKTPQKNYLSLPQDTKQASSRENSLRADLGELSKKSKLSKESLKKESSARQSLAPSESSRDSLKKKPRKGSYKEDRKEEIVNKIHKLLN